MDINFLVKITSRAWALPILALMHRGVPGRQAVLLAKTGAGRTAFAQSLAHLVELGLVERTPGHGHPLRPEYRLTAAGQAAGALAGRINAATPLLGEAPLLRRVWTVPILAVSNQPRFFTDIKKALPPITDRALSKSLKDLERNDWLRRDIDAAVHPPRARYLAVNAGASIGTAVSLDAA